VDLLTLLGLINEQEDARVSRTKAGDSIVRAARIGDLRPFGLVLVRAGCFHDQARVLVEAGAVDDAGNLRCPARVARTAAPQLLGVLQWWKEVQLRPLVTVPTELLAELNTVWALLPPPERLPAWLAERKAVGDRAEMYTVQLERGRLKNQSLVIWVARDSDTLGWDVEDHSVTPRRHIEVKGRRDDDTQFYLSDNEWLKARELGPQYEIQFWGNIDLNRSPANEYAVLRAMGFPIVISNPAVALTGPEWEMSPVSWRVMSRVEARSHQRSIDLSSFESKS
jgi:hypothetical protein